MIAAKSRSAPASWRVNHDELINQIRLQAFGLDWKVGEFERWARYEGEIMIAEAPVEIVGFPAPEGCAWGVGVENANNARPPCGLKIYTGLRLEGRGGAFVSMDVRALRHEHKLAEELPERVSATLVEAWGDRRYRGTLQQFVRWKERLENHPLIGEGAADRVLMRAYRNGLMPWEKIGKVEQAFAVELEPSTWDLLGCWAVIAEGCPPKSRMRNTLRFFRSLMAETGMSLN